MQSVLIFCLLALPSLSFSATHHRHSFKKVFNRRDTVDVSLIPPFQVKSGVDPDGTGNCRGINNALIPCDCPPNQDLFNADLIANVAAGHPVNNSGVPGIITFPNDNSIASAMIRFHTSTVTLQNFHGSGVGCPQVSTNWSAQANALQALQDQGVVDVPAGFFDSPSSSTSSTPPPPPPPPAPAPSSSSSGNKHTCTDDNTASTTTTTTTTTSAPKATASSTGGSQPSSSINLALVPPFGIVAGQDPDGTGNCRGVNNIAIPCSCPPDQTLFNDDLIANLAHGTPVNNTGAAHISFPEDDSIQSQLARFNAATETLQNLRGPGEGCPQAATTWGQQVAQLQSELRLRRFREGR